MNVTCDKCNKRYSIADDKVRGKSVKIRCKQCQNLISVQGPASGAVAAVAAATGVAPMTAAPALGSSPWEEERTRAMPAMDTQSQWFAMVKGKQLGPFDIRGLEGKVKTGELTLRTYLWRQGMGDWKRASDLPEVSPVFAGVASAGATATGPTSAAPAAERPSSKKVAPVQRDVAVALETPSPEITARKPNGNGNGHGASDRNTASSPAHQPSAAPAPAPAPSARSKGASTSQARAVARPVPAPSPAPAPTAPMPAPEPAVAKNAPLSDLFSDPDAPDPEFGNTANIRSGRTLDTDGDDEPGAEGHVDDPFAALGESDPAMAPPPGEATKFFIAQAGVNKRNPPWKIALFVLGAPALVVGVLFVLSSLHIVPLEVTHTNEQGEEVKESFFSAGGVSGLKDMLSGDAKKKKEEAEKARLAAEAKRKAQQQAAVGTAVAANDPGEKEKDKPPKPVDPALALIYGKDNSNPTGTSIHVRRSDREGQAQTDNSAAGLSAEATGKVVADKLKAFQSCIETALHRNPNLAVGSIEVVATVAPSGVVTAAEISPKKHENSDWGGCMRDVAKRIVFPKSDGETEVRIPLKVGVAVPL